MARKYVRISITVNQYPIVGKTSTATMNKLMVVRSIESNVWLQNIDTCLFFYHFASVVATANERTACDLFESHRLGCFAKLVELFWRDITFD